MLDAYIYDGIRSPIGRHAGKLAPLRPDDLAGEVIAEVVKRNGVKPEEISDVILGCVTQAGEDCRNVARFAALMAGLPPTTPGVTVNRLCASRPAGGDRRRARHHRGEGELYIAGGVESMTRAPFVIGKSESPYGRDVKMYDTTIGSRFTNPQLQEAVRRPGDARDRRQRGEGVQRLARAGRRVRARLAEEIRQGRAGGLLQGRDPGHRAALEEEGRAARHGGRRTSIRGATRPWSRWRN